MEIARVASELQGPVRRMPRLPLERAALRGLLWFALGLIPGRTLDGVTIHRRSATGAGHGAGLRVYVPAGRRSRAALLWIHGGGLVIGRAAMDDGHCAATARDLGIVVVSVDYRLAPRHPFPLPLDDCHAAWEWLQRNRVELDIDPARVAIGGQSAGGGLAAALVHRIVDGPGPDPVAQWLFCPMLDDRTAARRDLDADGHLVWDNRLNRFGWQSYLGTEPGGASVPRYASAARRDDLTGLPPAWIGIGDIDLFHEESLAYAGRLRTAGVEATFEVVPGAPHGFESWAPRTATAQAHLGRARAWLGRVTSASADLVPA